jgi:hypothetical protein
MSHPAAWQPDPTGKHDHRWWDGERWTEHVADAGQAGVDPLDRDVPPPSRSADDAPSSDVAGGSAGGWAQDASEQGRDPDAGGLAGGGAGGLAGDDPSGAASGRPQQGWQGGQQTGQQGWQQPDQGWQGGQRPDQGWQGQPGQQGWQGGGGPVWDQSGGGDPAWQTRGQGSRGNDGVAIAAMIVGILSLLIAWIPFLGLLGLIGGIVALVLGIVGRNRIKRSGAGGNGMAVAGIATGVVAVVLSIAVHAWLFTGGGGFVDEVGSYVECIEQTNDEEYCQQQLEEGIFERFGQ